MAASLDHFIARASWPSLDASPGANNWKQAFAQRSASAFADAFAADVVLEATTLREPVAGRENVKQDGGGEQDLQEPRLHRPGDAGRPAIRRMARSRLNESVLLYGKNAHEASRIDSFLDVSLIFGRDTQSYLLALRGESVTRTVRQSATTAFEIYLSGIERALRSSGPFLVGKELSLVDICFVWELALFLSERRQYQILRKKRLQPITWQAQSTYQLAS